MLKTLLVHIPSERLMRPVIESAVSLAMTYGAHLKAISIGYEMANVGVALGGAGAGVAAIFEVERERAEARANAALAVFETEARSAGITYGLEPLINTPFEAANTIGASARLHDLSIVLQPERDRDTFDNVVPLEIMIHSGRPVLFIPHIHRGGFDTKHVGIAWDGSRLAARAVHDAAPFLARAPSITIISVNEAQAPACASAADLATYLAQHSQAAKIERVNADRADIHAIILSIAADLGIDLVVMGAYGHSRLQERILGGVTRGILQSMTVPTLMSH
jgi:nucleotide-binding universal stress UspA family protein